MYKTTKHNLIFTLIMVVFSILLSIVGAIIFTLLTANELSSNSKGYIEQIIDQNTESFTNKIDALYLALEYSNGYFTELDTMSQDEIKSELTHLNKLGTFEDIVVFYPDGNGVSANYKLNNVSDRDYFKTACGGNRTFSRTLTDVSDGINYNVIAVPIKNNDNQIVGILAGRISENEFSKYLKSDSISQSASSYIVDEKGEIILAFNAKNVQTEFTANSNIFQYDCFDEETADNVKSDIGKVNSRGSCTIEGATEQCLLSYAPLNHNNWYLVTVLPNSEISVTNNTTFWYFICFAVCFVTVFTLITLGFLHAYNNKYRECETIRKDYDNLAYVDEITGFGTMKGLERHVKNTLKTTTAGFSIVSFDINKFRAVNDFLGYEEGNNILRKIAVSINRLLEPDEAFCRNTADNFYLFLSEDNERNIRHRIREIVNDIDYQIVEFNLSFSFGVYYINGGKHDFRVICDRADIAKRSIKNQNQTTVAFFNSEMLSRIRNEKEIENEMEHALEKGEFKVFLQPKFNLAGNNEVTGAEALVRWFHNGEIISPGSFIPLFEKNGFVLNLDIYMFEEVCKLQKIWQNKGLTPKIISVNMSRVHLKNPDFVKNLAAICKRFNISTKYFEIEITESAAFENLDVLIKVFNELHEYGFHSSIDDFGTGYSSLNMLKDLHVDMLKIDREFLTSAGENERANKIISHVIALAVNLGIGTICEGIETKEQVELLSSLKCDMAQGFYFAKPMSVANYQKMVYNIDYKGV